VRRNLPGQRAVLGLLTTALIVGSGVTASAAPVDELDVIVRAGDSASAAALVVAEGGSVGTDLHYLGAVTATLPPHTVAALDARPGVSVTPDQVLELSATDLLEAAPTTGHDNPQLEALSLPEHWTPDSGAGIGVALLDTGVAEVPELAGRVVRGPDLSDEDDGLDRHGHGTFMAGLIAGDGTDSEVDALRYGVAPGAHVVSVKLAGADGLTSLGRVLEGIGWVVEHRDAHAIRVLNLSLGVSSNRAPRSDPLSAAVQAAWSSGIVVVTASGNQGARAVTSPGRDPWVITVGATDGAAEPTVASWSGWGKVAGNDKPELLAPGVSVVSLRAPGSAVDVGHPEAHVDERYMRGSGTSMSAALVSGSVALLSELRPFATPDDLKGALAATGSSIPGALGAVVDVAAADAADADRTWRQSHPIHPAVRTSPGNTAMPWDRADAPGPDQTWQRARWMDGEWQRARWMDGEWQRARWMHDDWQRARWMDENWQRARWMDENWQRARWMGSEWQRARWMDEHWQRARWMEQGWQRARWMDDTWQRARWMDQAFARARWMDENWQRARWMEGEWARARWMTTDWSGEPVLTAPARWGDPAAAGSSGPERGNGR
jgi:serine protease AprX